MVFDYFVWFYLLFVRKLLRHLLLVVNQNSSFYMSIKYLIFAAVANRKKVIFVLLVTYLSKDNLQRKKYLCFFPEALFF